MKNKKSVAILGDQKLAEYYHPFFKSIIDDDDLWKYGSAIERAIRSRMGRIFGWIYRGDIFAESMYEKFEVEGHE